MSHARPTRFTGSCLALAVLACQEHTTSSPAGEGPPHLSVVYVCGNGFDLRNRSPAPMTVDYRVVGTPERGELLLTPSLDPTTASSTRLITLHAGSLEVSSGGDALSPVPNLAAECPPSGGPEPESTQGKWGEVLDWPVVAVHLHLLANGKVLSWGAAGMPQIWDPESGAFTGAPSATDLFCSGHAFLPDGKLLVTGGHITEHHGLPDANIFDPVSQSWTPVTQMSRGRWYPTSTTLPSGEVLTLAGRDEAGVEVDLPEVWTGSAWRPLTGGRRTLPYYPRMFVAPNGLVFYAGELQQTGYLDASGAGRWTPVVSSNYGRRDYGSAVMYRPGKVMIVGGSDPVEGAPTSTAEIIDLTEATPEWRYTDPMAHPRRQFNTTLLPDGRVLATGGTSAPGFSDPTGAVRVAELWDPVTEKWSVLASNRVTRAYHSTTLLLPDGRVLHAGSGDGAGLPRELNAEIFSPPYLFRGPRPSIADMPASVNYGERFFVAAPDAGRVVSAALVRLGSVTHGFDQNQRYVELPLQRVLGGLSLTAPVSSDLAPPGEYLLFIVNDAGVPSRARTVRLK